MKKSMLLLSILCFCTAAFAQKGAAITFDRTLEKMGTVAYKTKTPVTFTVSNSGDAPVVITGVDISCGCVKADYPKKPILPGQKASIVLTFDAKDKGAFYKVVHVRSNASPNSVELHLQGTVE